MQQSLTRATPRSTSAGVGSVGREAPIKATLNYLVDSGERPAVRVLGPGQESQRTGQYAAHAVAIHDMRGLIPEPNLDRQGFAFRTHDSAVADFYDDEAVRTIYCPEIERLVKEMTGAARVLVFDHTRRIDAGTAAVERGARKPVRIAHNDYTPRSAPRRVRDLLGDEQADMRLKRRFAQINVWRPIRGPVQMAPLAVADAQSIAVGDLVASDIVYGDRTGEIFDVAFNRGHRWYYLPEMAQDEVLLLKGYDSLDDGRARFTPHTAFDDPTTPPDALPRESIEIRTFAFFSS